MKRWNLVGLALGCVGLCLVAACSPSSGGAATGSAVFDAGNTSVVNASKTTGGTLNYGMTSTPDSTDPGNTYYAYNWNFTRLYARPLLSFQPAPGSAGLKLVPSLATGLGQVSNNGLTWTYHIQSGLKYEDGSPITTKDVKYAIERSNYARDVLPNGPTYFAQYLADPTYPGPYKDTSPDKMGLTSIETPNDTTIVFHLQTPFADFDYLVANPQTAPVPPAHDTGAQYQTHPWSSGPYKFSSYNPNTGFTMVKNTNWDPKTDPYNKQLVDKITVAYNLQAADLDARLLDGSIDIDLGGTGVQTAARSKILSTPSLKNNADAALSGFLWYGAINTQVIPNVDCRRAINYAVDKTVQQAAYGGPLAGGDIASTVLPPNIVGYQKFDNYAATTQVHGDLVAAKSELQKCGQPNGFTFNIAARSDRPKEVAAATGIQQALAKVGIKTDILQYPSGQYTGTYAGSPQFMQQHNIGLALYGWAADWPDGFGFLQQIADGRAIKQAGNSNISMLNDPQINSLFDQAAASTDANTRNQIYAQIDKIMMDQAVVLPEVYAKSLLYRSPKLTNVYVSAAYGMYDYTQIGKTP
jgi:peptide/nickel transport system substrate-binding protein